MYLGLAFSLREITSCDRIRGQKDEELAIKMQDEPSPSIAMGMEPHLQSYNP